MLKPTFAIIDLGTNTFHLLITDGNKTLHELRRPVRLGQGGINHNNITAEAIERAKLCLKDYKQIAQDYGAQKIIAIGTSAVRNASNASFFISEIFQHTGIEIKIISGEQEAEYIYQGVRSGVDLGSNNSLIMDIGGGSVEFIIANHTDIFWKQSFEIGGQRLIEKFEVSDPIMPEEVMAIRKFLEIELMPLKSALRKFTPDTLVGSSGSFDTLSEIYCLRNQIPYSPDGESPITMDFLILMMELILKKDRQERMQIPGMIELRVDLIVVGVVLIRQLLEMWDFSNIRVSSYSLKEGVRAVMLK
jgi:exopolyphosphatase/guanosine-5'-triphosphate,3'-diphosphate pyrophosphatase